MEQYPLPELRYLYLEDNNIQDIPSSLENYTNLERLWLSKNKIGSEGCRSIAKLLQEDGSRLRDLRLSSNDIGDEDAEMLANSLKSNTSLKTLSLAGDNDINEEGCTAFSRLLNDVSSIDNTYNSNHTLTTLCLPRSTDAAILEVKKHIESAIKINKNYDGNSHEAGRAKVIDNQLNSQKRNELCRLQGIGYSHGSIFADIDPILLPEVLALVVGRHSQRELYRVLIATVPYLASAVNRKAAIQGRIAENAARIAALTANHKHDQDALTADYKRKQATLTAKYTRESSTLASTNRKLNEELQSIESEGGEQSRVMNASSTVHADSRGCRPVQS